MTDTKKTPKPKVLYLHNAARFGDALQERVEAMAKVAHVTTADLDATPNLEILKAITAADVVLHERHRNAQEEDRLDVLKDHARESDVQFQELPGNPNELATFIALRPQLKEYGEHLAREGDAVDAIIDAHTDAPALDADPDLLKEPVNAHDTPTDPAPGDVTKGPLEPVTGEPSQDAPGGAGPQNPPDGTPDAK